MEPNQGPGCDQFFRELFQSSLDMQYSCDLDGRITAANSAAEMLTAYSLAELLSMQVGNLLTSSRDSNMGRGACPTPGVHNYEILTKEGSSVSVEVATTQMANGFHGLVRETGERKLVEEQLRRLEIYDPLTGLFNRRHFQEQLQVQLAQARKFRAPGALLFLDLDFFKDVNDSLGHSSGDQVLTEVAQLLRDRFPENAILGRLGGDEYGVLLPSVGGEEAEPVARKVLVCLQNEQLGPSGRPATVSASVGIAHIPSDGFVTAEELLARSDLALREAKEKGRNRVVIYSAGIDWQAQLEVDLTWRRKISEALEHGRFILYAQPIQDLARDFISSYELLIRMRDGDGQVVSAYEFITKAERFGLIRAIDEWVADQAALLLEAQVGRAPVPLRLAINVSGSSLSDPHLVDRLRTSLDSGSADASNLVIEVTESACIENLADAQRFIKEVHRLGCKVSLDDFGVGSSSFAHLKLLNVDYLKIDGSFIRNIAHDPTDRELVKAIVAIGRALGKETVAEYVVDEATLEVVRELGVDFAQGAFVGEAEDAACLLSADTPRGRRPA